MRKYDLETTPAPPIGWRPRARRGKGVQAQEQDAPRRRNVSWSDQVRFTDKGAEGQRGDNYYFDEDGNIVNRVTGRKGHIVLDETKITPKQGYIDENGKIFKDQLKQGDRYALRSNSNSAPNFKFNGSPLDNAKQALWSFRNKKDPFHALSYAGLLPVNFDDTSTANISFGAPMRSISQILKGSRNVGRSLSRAAQEADAEARIAADLDYYRGIDKDAVHDAIVNREVTTQDILDADRYDTEVPLTRNQARRIAEREIEQQGRSRARSQNYIEPFDWDAFEAAQNQIAPNTPTAANTNTRSTTQAIGNTPPTAANNLTPAEKARLKTVQDRIAANQSLKDLNLTDEEIAKLAKAGVFKEIHTPNFIDGENPEQVAKDVAQGIKETSHGTYITGNNSNSYSVQSYIRFMNEIARKADAGLLRLDNNLGKLLIGLNSWGNVQLPNGRIVGIGNRAKGPMPLSKLNKHWQNAYDALNAAGRKQYGDAWTERVFTPFTEDSWRHFDNYWNAPNSVIDDFGGLYYRNGGKLSLRPHRRNYYLR